MMDDKPSLRDYWITINAALDHAGPWSRVILAVLFALIAIDIARSVVG